MTEKSASNSTSDQLRSYIERVERLEEEKKNLSMDVSEIFKEAKSNGYDVKTMKEIIKIRKKNHSDLLEEAHLLETYKAALGME